jgi:hypothetical protein
MARMILRQPVAAWPLALLTLAVLAAHLLVLDRAWMREPAPPPAAVRTLVTRVLTEPRPQTPVQAAAPAPAIPQPVLQEAAVRPRPLPAQRPPLASTETEAATTPVAPPLAAAPPAADGGSGGAASAPAPPTEVAAAPAPAPEPTATPDASALPPMAFTIPGSVRLRYAVTGLTRGQKWNVNGELLWHQDGSQYEARLAFAAPLLPSHAQQSTGRITAEGLAPLRFSDKSRGEQATHFERDSGTLIFSSNTPQQPLLPGAQDRLSVYLQLASMLAAAPEKFPAGTAITLQTAGARDSQPWVFTVEGDESLDLPGGRVAARRLVRNPSGQYDIRVELWLGTAMDYIPVRIRLTQANGDFVDQQWAATDKP